MLLIQHELLNEVGNKILATSPRPNTSKYVNLYVGMLD